jgi:hypothetical protein
MSLALHEVYWEHSTEDLAYIFRQGKCPRCGTTARSRKGRMVVASERPPLQGRQAR